MEQDIEKLVAEERGWLSGVTRETPALKAVLRMLRRQGEVEVAQALPPGLGNEGRQYNAGRAAAVLDVVAMVEEAVPKGKD